MNWKYICLAFLIALSSTFARPSDIATSSDQPSEASAAEKQSSIRSALLSRRYLQPNLYRTDSINPLDPIFVEYKESSNNVINDFFKKSIPFLLHGTSRSFTNFPKKPKLNSTNLIVNKLSKIKTKPPDDDDDQESRYGSTPYADRMSYYEYHKPPAAEVNIASNSGTHYYSHHYPSAAVAYQQKPSFVAISPSQVNIPTYYTQLDTTTTTSPRPPLPPPFSTRPMIEIPRPIKVQSQIQQKPVPKPTLLISSRPTPLEYRPINDVFLTTERPQLYTAVRPTFTVIDNNSYPIRKNNTTSYTNFMTETFNGYDYMRPPSFNTFGNVQTQSYGDLSPQSAEIIYLNNTLHILKKPLLLGSADPEDPDPSFLSSYSSAAPTGYGDIIVEDAKNASSHDVVNDEQTSSNGTTAIAGDIKKCSNVKITVTDSVSFQVNQDPCEDNINVNLVSSQSANDTKSAAETSAAVTDEVEDEIGKKVKKGKKKKQKYKIKKKKQKFKKKKKEPTPIELTLHHPEPELVPVLAQVQQPHLEVYDKKKKKGGKRKKGNKQKGNKKRRKGQQTEYVYVHDDDHDHYEEDWSDDHYDSHDDHDDHDVYEYEVKKKYKKKPPAPAGVIIQHQFEHVATPVITEKKKKRKKKKRKHKPDDDDHPTYIIKKPEYIIKKPHKTHDHFKELLYAATKYVPVIILALLNPMTLLAKALIFLPFKFFIFGTAGLAILLYPFISGSYHQTPKKSFRSHPGFTIHHDHRHKFLSKRPPPHWRPSKW